MKKRLLVLLIIAVLSVLLTAGARVRVRCNIQYEAVQIDNCVGIVRLSYCTILKPPAGWMSDKWIQNKLIKSFCNENGVVKNMRLP